MLADAWLPNLVPLGELERHLGDGVIEEAAVNTRSPLKPGSGCGSCALAGRAG